MNQFLKLFKKEHKGVEAFEFVILSPVLYLTLVALLYGFFMITSYIYFNNIANKIASGLNARKESYIASYNRTILPDSDYEMGNAGNGNGGVFNRNSQIECANEYIKRATIHILDDYVTEHKAYNPNFKIFGIPFTDVSKIKIETSKPLNISVSTGSEWAGTCISVTIEYRSTFFMKSVLLYGKGLSGLANKNIDILTLKAKGYGNIT